MRSRPLSSHRRASGLPCGLSRRTLLQVQRDRVYLQVMDEATRTERDFFTVSEKSDDTFARWFLCGLAGLSARVVGGLRVCTSRRSPGVGVNRRRGVVRYVHGQ